MGRVATVTIVLLMLLASLMVLPSTNASRNEISSVISGEQASMIWDLGDAPPGPVIGLNATSDIGKVLVTWMAPDINASHYRIYRGPDANLTNATMVGNVTDTYWYDDTVIDGTTYYYFVEPMNDFGLGPISSISVVSGSSIPMNGLRIDNDGELLAYRLFYGWTGGGSISDPITIAGLDIDAIGQGDGIFLGNTTYHVSIRDGVVRNASTTNYGDYIYNSGVVLYNSTNVRIENLTLIGNTGNGVVMDHAQSCILNGTFVNASSYGVQVLDSLNCVVSGNEVFGCIKPMYVYNSEQCAISDNVLGRDGENISEWLLYIYSKNCSVHGNTFHGNRLPVYESDRLVPGYGMDVSGGGNLIYENTLVNCSISLNLYHFGDLDGFQIFNNTVNGEPVYYFHDLDMTGIEIPIGAGEVLLYNVTNATVQGQEQSSSSFLVQAVYCHDITVRENAAHDCRAAICLKQCFGNVLVDDNEIDDCYMGIFTQYFDDNQISNNSFTRCDFGVYLEHWNHRNQLTGNDFLNGTYGLWFGYANSDNVVQGNRFVNNSDFAIILEEYSYHNDFFSNQFIDNNGAGATYDQNHSQVRDYKDKTSPGNTWQNGTNDGHGNLWSDQTGPDVDLDGIVDVPYLIATYPFTGTVFDLRPLAYISGPPGRVSNLSAIVMNGAVELHWGPANNSVVVGTEGYKVYRWDSPSHRTLVSNGTETSYNESGLSDGITYHYQVSAYNDHGEGPLSLNITVVSPTFPGAPINLTGTISNGEASLQWEAPMSDGGAVIDHYEIYRNEVKIMDVPGLIANVSDLSVGVTYTFTIRAHNTIGAGPESDTVVLIERTVPNAPVLTADWGDESVDLTWTTPFNGGAIITHYILYKQLPGYSEWSELARTQGNSYTDLEVENGQTYAYQVRAVNSVGDGGLSNEVRDAPRSVPSAPELYILNPGNTILFAAWTAPDDDGGSAVDNFSVYVDDVFYANTTGSNLTITGLTNGITYSVTVRAHNSVGTGPASEPMSAKPIAIPGAPTDLNAVVGPNTVTLDWNAPSEIGGVTPLQYRVYERKVGVSVFTPIGTTTQTSYLVTMGLADRDIDFDYRVESFNTLGVGGNATVLDVSPSILYIAGKVVDQDGNALAQVTVHIQGGGQVLSDQAGSFIIQTQPGTVTLWINGTGFESESHQVQVGSAPVQMGTIPLEPVQMDETTAGIDPLLLVIPAVLVVALLGAFLVLRRRK